MYYMDILFCSLAVLDPRVGHTMDVLSPFILCPMDITLTILQWMAATTALNT